MSHLKHCLDLLGFTDIQDVTADSLKKAFKVTVLKAHPDKGGQQEDFDSLLSAYLYVLEMMNRVRGGRRTLHDVVSPEELKESRVDEIVNRIFEEFEREAFNAAFEAANPRTDHGYADWLRDASEDTHVVEGAFGSATQLAPTVKEEAMQEEFERMAREGKPAPSSHGALILHPDEMAYVSGQMLGAMILDEGVGSYTSDLYQTPEYTDVYSAFTNDNTMCDKVAPFTEKGKTLEELVAEREAGIAPLQDTELAAIAEFEAKKKQQEKEHFDKVKDYYQHVRTMRTALTNWRAEPEPERTDTPAANFIIQL